MQSYGKYVVRALKAQHVFVENKDYLIRDGKVVIVDPATGRLRRLTRWTAGIHQALEAKHGLHIGQDQEEIASINYTALFKMYSKLSGMTGTATQQAKEFRETYGLTVVSIPPHRPSCRVDHPYEVYAGYQVQGAGGGEGEGHRGAHALWARSATDSTQSADRGMCGEGALQPTLDLRHMLTEP